MRTRFTLRRADTLRTVLRARHSIALAALAGGLLALAAALGLAAGAHGMTPHMTAHMTTVVLAAPLFALAARGTAFDAAAHWPAAVQPVQMSVVELVAVWSWHVPAARAFAASGIAGAVLEQLTFVAAGWLLWIACFGGGARGSKTSRRGAAVIALLLTTMHMTLLGVLIALAPRVLYETHGFAAFGFELAPLQDQQLGGVVMLTVGAGAYLAAGLWFVAGLLQAHAPRTAEAEAP